jgi:NAD(P)-dependent dehydrogenase (short-subunit alcohol dehydrogenase family)
MRVQGRTAIITGAGAGVGRAAAMLFAAEGANVVAVDLEQQRAADVVTEIVAAGGSGLALAADVATADGNQRMVDAAMDAYGQLDILYCNAGVGPVGGGAVPFEQTTLESWDRVIAVNLTGVFLGCRAAVPALAARGNGAIVVTSSASGFLGVPGMSIYAATKAGIHGLVRNLALDLGHHGIRVNAVAPSGFGPTNFFLPHGSAVVGDEERRAVQAQLETSHYPLDRLASVEEIAAAALFLASDEASWVTGVALAVDGGLTARSASPAGFAWGGPS